MTDTPERIIPLPKRSALELAEALRGRADCLTGEAWEIPATAAMMHEAAVLLCAHAATIAQLQQRLARIEAETNGWIADLVAEGGARKVGPLEHILAVVQSHD